MADLDEKAVMLPGEVVARARALATERKCTLGEAVSEALHRYREAEQLLNAIAGGAGREEALEEFLNDYVVRMVHEVRAERRAETLGVGVGSAKGERVAS